MASEPETFESIDWAAVGGTDRLPSLSTAVFLALQVVLVPAVVWDNQTVTDFGYTVAELQWHATALDWLTLFALTVLVSFGLVPALQRPGRVRAVLGRYPKTPGAVLSAVGVGALVVLGVLGPELVAYPEFNFERQTQPPVGFRVLSTFTNDCVTVAGGDYCRGTWAAPLGTTEDGHDIVGWLAYGTRTTVQFVLVAVTLIAPLAVGVGSVAGYLGGRWDAVLSRVIEVQQTVPTFIVYFLAVIFVGPTLFVLVLVYGLFDWADTAALVRSEARSLRTESYVRAARSAGATKFDVLRRHVVPNVGDAVLTSVSTLIPKLVLVEALFAFLKLSSAESRSWGRLIFRGIGNTGGVSQLPAFDQLWWIATIPTAAVALTVIVTTVFGDALRDALDARD
jgi:peptide/nickel transport system permease protein